MTSPNLALQEPDSAQAELATPSYGLPGPAREPASAPELVLVQPWELQQAWELQAWGLQTWELRPWVRQPWRPQPWVRQQVWALPEPPSWRWLS